MTRIESSIRIDAPKDKVWAVLADFGGIQKFHPGLKSSHSTSEANEGVGATRQCVLKPMGTIQERIVEWKDGEEMLVEIYEGKNMPPLDFEDTKARLSARAEGDKTVVTMKMAYETKGLAGAAMNPVLKSQFSKTVPSILQGLKYYVENGKKATSKELKQTFAAAAA